MITASDQETARSLVSRLLEPGIEDSGADRSSWESGNYVCGNQSGISPSWNWGYRAGVLVVRFKVGGTVSFPASPVTLTCPVGALRWARGPLTHVSWVSPGSPEAHTECTLVPLWVGLQDGTLVDTGVPVVSNEQHTPAAPLLPVETSEEELRSRHHARRSRRLESLRKGTLPGGRLPPCGWCQGVCVEDQRSLGADPAALIDRSLALDRLIDQALASREDEGGRA